MKPKITREMWAAGDVKDAVKIIQRLADEYPGMTIEAYLKMRKSFVEVYC